jgi:hypothetical protein
VIIKDKVFAQEQAFNVVAVYKVAAGYKIKGGGISIHSYTNYLNIKVIKKVFKGEVIIK